MPEAHGGGVANRRGKSLEAAPQQGVALTGGEFTKRLEHEGSLVQVWMGNDEPGLVDAAAAVDQQVEIEQAGSPALWTAFAASAAFDLEQLSEERTGIQSSAHSQHRIQVGRLGYGTDRLGLVDSRFSAHLDAGDLGERRLCKAQLGGSISQVRTEGNIGDDRAAPSGVHGGAAPIERPYSAATLTPQRACMIAE